MLESNPGAQNVEALPDTLRTVISSHGDVLDFTTVTEMQTLKTAKAAIPDTISHHGDENRKTQLTKNEKKTETQQKTRLRAPLL